MKKTNAFTLAEVLITLVIIGVIAAMTIPTLMGSTNNQEIKTALKKAVSMVNQAILTDSVMYGSTTGGGCNNLICTGEEPNQECHWDDCSEGQTRLGNILKNHLNVIEETNNDEFVTADGMYFQTMDGGNVRVDVNGRNKAGGVFVLSHFENLKEFRPNWSDTGEDINEFYYNN